MPVFSFVRPSMSLAASGSNWNAAKTRIAGLGLSVRASSHASSTCRCSSGRIPAQTRRRPARALRLWFRRPRAASAFRPAARRGRNQSAARPCREARSSAIRRAIRHGAESRLCARQRHRAAAWRHRENQPVTACAFAGDGPTSSPSSISSSDRTVARGRPPP